MQDKFLASIKDFMLAGELTRLNTADIRELRKQNENLTLLVERLAFEIQRIRETRRTNAKNCFSAWIIRLGPLVRNFRRSLGKNAILMPADR